MHPLVLFLLVPTVLLGLICLMGWLGNTVLKGVTRIAEKELLRQKEGVNEYIMMAGLDLSDMYKIYENSYYNKTSALTGNEKGLAFLRKLEKDLLKDTPNKGEKPLSKEQYKKVHLDVIKNLCQEYERGATKEHASLVNIIESLRGDASYNQERAKMVNLARDLRRCAHFWQTASKKLLTSDKHLERPEWAA